MESILRLLSIKKEFKVKKSIIGMFVSAMFVMGTAHAADTSAVVSITGTVVQDIDDACTVVPSTNVINLTSDINVLPTQGNNATSSVPGSQTLSLTVTGAGNCLDKVAEGHISYKFVGQADASLGTVLANTATGDNAAQNIGVGIYDQALHTVAVNSTLIPAKKDEATTVTLQLVKLAGSEDMVYKAGAVDAGVTIEIERL
ncbi:MULTISPECIES: fimbrial protein [Enterobacter cloacae complex]|uniref:fimbrial protein n=1 Tax=Enterobacter cloacae complex TaxID=354276 RepID=UPI00187528BD|nr:MULTISPECIES: type 1 fimbrial protein [Enterobacter cloacae complex]MBE4895984.1 type 1 fimbrial protein [Enterobacter cloacae complex sp. P16RS2]